MFWSSCTFTFFFLSKIEILLKKDRLDLLWCTFAAPRFPRMCNQLADAGWHCELIEFKVEDLRENCFESNDMISANVIGGAARWRIDLENCDVLIRYLKGYHDTETIGLGFGSDRPH